MFISLESLATEAPVPFIERKANKTIFFTKNTASEAILNTMFEPSECAMPAILLMKE